MSIRHFQQVRGFDEVFSGYGGEDLDFYWRLSRMGAQRLLCEPTDVIRAIEHSPQLRSAHYEVKDIRTGEQVTADPATWTPPAADLLPRVVSPPRQGEAP